MMRASTLHLAVVLWLAIPAGATAQELGAFGVGSQLWTLGDTLFRGAGATLTFVRPIGLRPGLRLGTSVFEIHSGSQFPCFDDTGGFIVSSDIARDVACGGDEARSAYFVHEISAIIQPFRDQHEWTRWDLGLGLAMGSGHRLSTTFALELSVGTAWRLGSSRSWLHVGYDQRLRPGRRGGPDDPLNAQRDISRHSVRVGLLYDFSERRPIP